MTSHRRTLSLLAALLAVLVPLISAVAGAVIWQGYRKSLQVGMDAGLQLFQGLQTEIAVQQQGMFEPLRFIISTFADDPDFGAGAPDRYLEPFMTVLERYPHVSSFRVGYDTGELFEVTAFSRTDPGAPSSAMAPQGAAFGVHTIGKDARETWQFFDARRMAISTYAADGPPRDPRGQLWYTKAKVSPSELIETEPYTFAVIAQPGISVAKAFAGARSGVLAADITLAQMSNLVGGLASDPNEQLFMFFGDGDLIAHPDPATTLGTGPWNPDEPLRLPKITTLTDPLAQAMVTAFQSSGAFGIQTLMVGGVPYLASVVQLGASPVHMAIALPEGNFTGVFDTIAGDSALISLGILALSIPLIVLVARQFSKPLALLAKQTDRIAQFDLGFNDSTDSRIAEIAQLGESMEKMRAALGQVTKFVPKSLVQDLVRSGAAMDVGGERRTISVLFTDVKDFTTLAETLPAEELMAQMSEYFDVVVRAVLANGGTVDKYVGDAVFAFWNAPSKQTDHEILACRAALAAQDASNALNRQWRAAGKPVWYTRLGVHVGDAVVGNVGLTDRLDYTAIGDTVNMGSRLEGLNKIYTTQILASGAIVEKTAAVFLFRPIDVVIPKGAVNPIEIFELRAERSSADTPHVQLCAAWQPVIEAYRRHDWPLALGAVQAFMKAYPDDDPAKVLAQRLTQFVAVPPPPEWDGTTRYDSK